MGWLKTLKYSTRRSSLNRSVRLKRRRSATSSWLRENKLRSPLRGKFPSVPTAGTANAAGFNALPPGCDRSSIQYGWPATMSGCVEGVPKPGLCVR